MLFESVVFTSITKPVFVSGTCYCNYIIKILYNLIKYDTIFLQRCDKCFGRPLKASLPPPLPNAAKLGMVMATIKDWGVITLL